MECGSDVSDECSREEFGDVTLVVSIKVRWAICELDALRRTFFLLHTTYVFLVTLNYYCRAMCGLRRQTLSYVDGLSVS
jgi:hypothetical protein